jgi:catechol 2,3-dioxygenase-like lactoylglutathione lyase family enzyme
MKIKSSSITINVKDLDKSIAFYQSIGFELKERWSFYYAQMAAADIVIGLHPTKEDELKGNSGNVSIGITVENFGKLKTELDSLSIEFKERKEQGGNFIHIADPDGTAVYFIDA